MDGIDRDPRTVRVRMLQQEPCCSRCSSVHTPSLTHRLGEVLTLCACLLSLLPWPSAMAAPSGRLRIPADRPRLWVNPCGYSPSDDQTIHEMTLSNKDVLNNIIVQTVTALASVDRFKNEYVLDTFDVSFHDHHKNWEKTRYDWLFPKDQVPKSLGSETESELLEGLKVETFLKDAYRLLQIMAVALEQVAWDQTEPKYITHFKDVEYKLKSVLCEIQLAMLEMNINAHPDVGREVMTDEFRDITDDSFRSLRDWFIFRDYMIVLEYIRDVLQFFVDHEDKIPPS